MVFLSGMSRYPFHSVHVIAGHFDRGAEVEGIIGRNLLDHCIFQYFGPDRRFTLAF